MTRRQFAIVPAAGIGSRMGASIPKQYLTLLNSAVIEHSILRLLSLPSILKVMVVIGPNDQHWSSLPIASHPQVQVCLGGESRSDSVLCGLKALSGQIAPKDWVLVHDAARPCVSTESIQNLIEKVELNHACGGLLAVPVADTIKRAIDSGVVVETVPRNHLWCAQTPQMFEWEALYGALIQAYATQKMITDESSAMEIAGFEPLLVEGRSDNIKITHPSDLSLAEVILSL